MSVGDRKCTSNDSAPQALQVVLIRKENKIPITSLHILVYSVKIRSEQRNQVLTIVMAGACRFLENYQVTVLRFLIDTLGSSNTSHDSSRTGEAAFLALAARNASSSRRRTSASRTLHSSIYKTLAFIEYTFHRSPLPNNSL